MESNGTGGYSNERMDRVEAILNQVAADHILLFQQHQVFEQEHQAFLQEHQMLLRAQIVMQDTMQQLAIAQKTTDERLNILITTVDGWIRSNPRATN